MPRWSRPVNSTTAQRQATLGANYQPRPRTDLPDFPAWNLSPAGPWNYALCVSEQTLKDVQVAWNPDCVDPLDAANPALRVVAKARRVRGWHLVHVRRTRHFGHWAEGDRFCRGNRTLQGSFRFTPPLPDPQSYRPNWPRQRKSRRFLTAPPCCASRSFRRPEPLASCVVLAA